MAEQIVWVATSGEYSDYGIRAIFDNEEAAKQMVTDGLADDYDSWQLDSKSPTARDSWYVTYYYNLDTSQLTETSDGYRSRVADIAPFGVAEDELLTSSVYRNSIYVEPTPGNPQPAGSGRRPGPMLNISIGGARTKEAAHKSALDLVARWKAEEAGL